MTTARDFTRPRTPAAGDVDFYRDHALAACDLVARALALVDAVQGEQVILHAALARTEQEVATLRSMVETRRKRAPRQLLTARACIRCGAEFYPKHGGQKCCVACGPIHDKEYRAKAARELRQRRRAQKVGG